MGLKVEEIPLPGRMSYRAFSELLAGFLSRIRVRKVAVEGSKIILTHEVKEGEVLDPLNTALDAVLRAPYDMIAATQGAPVPARPSLLAAAASALLAADAAETLPLGWVVSAGGFQEAQRYLGVPLYRDPRVEEGYLVLLAGVDEGGGYASATRHFIASVGYSKAATP